MQYIVVTEQNAPQPLETARGMDGERTTIVIDFTPLSDDQLIELIRSACAEAVSRGAVVEAAAKAAVLSEQEKARIQYDAAAREAERVKAEEVRRIAEAAAEKVRQEAEQKAQQERSDKEERNWKLKKGLAQRVEAVFGPGCTLTVWQKEAERRVYIDRKLGFGKREVELVRVEYYATGNRYNPPGTIAISGSEVARTAEEKEIARRIVEKAAKDWSQLKVDCDDAQGASIEVPLPEEFAAYREARIKRQREEAEQKEAKRRAEVLRDASNPAVLAARLPDLESGMPAAVLVFRDQNSRLSLRDVNFDTPTRDRNAVGRNGRIRCEISGATALGCHGSHSYYASPAEWSAETQALFTPDQLAALAEPAKLPALDYEAACAALGLVEADGKHYQETGK